MGKRKVSPEQMKRGRCLGKSSKRCAGTKGKKALSECKSDAYHDCMKD